MPFFEETDYREQYEDGPVQQMMCSGNEPERVREYVAANLNNE